MRNKSLLSVIQSKNNTYHKFEMYKIENDAPIRHRVSPQRPVINLFGNQVAQYTWIIESVRL